MRFLTFSRSPTLMTDSETSWEGGIGARFWSARRCMRKKVMDQERLFHYVIILGQQKTSGFMILLMIFLVFWKRTQNQIWMKMRHFGVDRVSKLRLESRLAITTQGSNYINASWGAYLVFFGLVIGFILVEKCCSVDYSAWGRMYLWDGFGIHRLNLEIPCRLKGFKWIIKVWDALVWSLS